MVALSLETAGVAMPVLGFGTWKLDGEVCQRLVEAALEIGYRHIDTAAAYRNEKQVGAAIAASGIPRDQLFVTTKIWRDHLAEGDLQAAAEKCLGRLGLDQIDLLLLHSPQPEPPLEETIVALNDVKSRGWTRAIGVSNYPSGLLARAAELSEAPLATNQIEYHPYLSQRVLLERCRAMGAALTAWSPLAQGKVADDPVLTAIGAAHGKTTGQVTLRWLIQQDGVIAIPRTSSAVRAAENFDIFDFELTGDEMRRIHDLAHPDGRLGKFLNPAFAWDEA